MAYSIVKATQQHVESMLPHVRQADRNEVMASSGKSVNDLLPNCVERAEMAWAGMVDDEVACIFGVQGASLLSETGFPWMIGTPLIEQHAKAFIKRNRKMVGVMLKRYPHLINYVDARNLKAIKWLQWLGFEIKPAEKFGAYQMMFHPFEMNRGTQNL